MSNLNTMQRLSTVSAGAVLALLGIFVFMALRDEPPPGVASLFGPPNVPTILFPANGSRLPVQLSAPSPDIWRVTLDTIPVVAPKPVNGYIGDFPPFWGDPSRISSASSRYRAILPPNTALEPTPTAP
jgi:hypothetical protein